MSGGPSTQDDPALTTAGRISQIRVFLLACTLLWVPVTIRNLALGRIAGWANLAAFVFCLAVWQLSRRTATEGGLRATAHLALAGNGAALLGSALMNGGQVTTPFLLAILPPVAAYTLGIRPAILWALLAFCGASAVPIAGRVLHLHVEFAQGPPELILGHYLPLFAALLVLSIASRRAADAQIAKASRSEALVRMQADELTLARDAALDAGRAKSAFLANMSHELRTPLNAVIGMASVLDDADLSDDQRECLATIRTGGETLLGLISDILDFSKIEAGKLELEHRPVELAHCLEDAIDLVAPAAASKGLELTYAIGDDVPAWITTDRGRLQQVLLNLLSNAVKFTDAGDVSVTVTARPLPGGAHELEFQVKDDGIGIPADKQARLFQTFSQVDASTTRRYGGSGLGLAISKALVGLLGGTLRVESAPGQGSTFAFTLRTQAVVEPATPAPHPPDELRGKTVLLVGAHRGVRAMVARPLAQMGATVEAVDSSRDAAAAGPWTIAIVDAGHAPAEDVGEALALRARFPDRPLVLLVPFGRHAAATLDLAHQPGVATVPKPVKPLRLAQALAQRAEPGGPTSRSRLTSGSSSPTAPLRLLLVEDNLVNQRVQRRLLEQLGHHVDVVSDGAEALEVVRRRGFDAIFLDLQMPGLDGLETARRLVAGWPPEERGRLIALTANAGREDRAACMAAGMDDYLSKPVRLSDLEAALRRVTPGARATPVLDTEAISRLMELEDASHKSLVTSLVEIFFDDARRRLASLAEGLARDDRDAIALQAHSLKGSAGALGLVDVATVAGALEAASKAGDLPDLEAPAQELRAALARAEPVLRETVTRLAATAAPRRAAGGAEER
jgi:signal transduction histidine kinase/CheY-like chemotaxis protein